MGEETTKTPLELLAEWVVERRRELHLSQPRLADRMGVSVRTVARIESGKENMKLGTLIQLAKALEVDCDLNMMLGQRTAATFRISDVELDRLGGDSGNEL